MRTLLHFTLCMLMFCVACLSALAQSGNDVFQLPDGQARAAYQVDIEAVLREKYRQRIETGVNNSILQWSVVDGELPAGLTIRTNGQVAGTPETPRERPYVFRVKVVDRSMADSSSLMISLSVVIAPPRLRLARIEGPALVPMDNSTPASQGSGPQLSDASETSGPDVSRTPVMTSQPEVKNNSHLPAPVDVATSRSGGGGILKKIAGMAGLPNKPKTPKRCEAGSSARRMVSDEAHTPLEGDTSNQNTCVEFHNLNTLKYRYEFNTKTTRTEGPDLSTLPFLPKITPTAATPAPKANTPPPGENTPGVIAMDRRTPGIANAINEIKDDLRVLDERFNTVASNLNEAENELRNVEELINQRVTAAQNAHSRSIRLANAADLYLQSNNTAPLLTEVRQTKGDVDTARKLEWPSAELTTVMTNLNELTIALEGLRFDNLGKQDISQEAWTEWIAANQDRYSRVRDRIAELKTKINTDNGGLEAFNTTKNKLDGWFLVLENVDNQQAAAFRQEAFVSCQTDEAESKSNQLSITKTDRTVQNASAVTREVLKVSCYSRVAFTAGFNFSTLDEKEFSVVNSAGTEGATVKKFGFTNRSSFRPNPLALLNFRFTEYPNFNWHASFGAVVDLKGQTGTDVEPIAGVSFSFRRFLFITPFALHFGRVNKLAGGFKEGDVVPESIATPPIEKAWKVGYTGGITFRIAPQ
jgi:Putative Ig domain